MYETHLVLNCTKIESLDICHLAAQIRIFNIYNECLLQFLNV